MAVLPHLDETLWKSEWVASPPSAQGCYALVVMLLIDGKHTPPRCARHPSQEGDFLCLSRKNSLLRGVPRSGGVCLPTFEQATS